MLGGSLTLQESGRSGLITRVNSQEMSHFLEEDGPGHEVPGLLQFLQRCNTCHKVKTQDRAPKAQGKRGPFLVFPGEDD